MDKSLFQTRRDFWSIMDRSWPFRMLRTIEPIGVIMAVVALIYTAVQYEEDRQRRHDDHLIRQESREIQRKTLHSLAWQTLESARGRGFNAGAAEALETLRDEGFIDMTSIELSGTWLSGADLRSVIAEHSNFSNARLDRANLDGATMSRANLQGVLLTHASLTGVKLVGANLEGANLSFAKLKDVDFSYVISIGELTRKPSGKGLRNFVGTVLVDADLGYADLSGSDLTGADLSGASLVNADLTDAVLFGATLSGTDLSSARLTQDQLDQACADQTRPPIIPPELELPPKCAPD